MLHYRRKTCHLCGVEIGYNQGNTVFVRHSRFPGRIWMVRHCLKCWTEYMANPKAGQQRVEQIVKEGKAEE